MKNIKNIIRLTLVAFMVFAAVLMQPADVKADVEEKDFIYQDEAGDLAVVFRYEGQQPDITFISPSGKEYTAGVNPEAEIVAEHGDGFSSYKIPNAEAGQWKIRLDRKDNGEIKFSVIDDVDGIAIQSFEILEIVDETAKVRFDVSMGEGDIVTYDYVISAIAGEDESAKKELCSGRADTGLPVDLDVYMNLSSYGDYRLLLEVTYTDGLEMFHSMTTDSFKYTNPNTPEAMEDFVAYVYADKNMVRLDWEGYAPRCDEFNVIVIGDGDDEEPVFTGTVTDRFTSFYYKKDVKELEITIYYKDDGVLSEPVSKKIDLADGESLNVLTDEVTGDSQVKLSYATEDETTLNVKLNEEEGQYTIKDSDEILFGLSQGVNNIEASFLGEDNIYYCVKEEIYYSTISPTITFYEDFNGKTFKDDEVTIYGKVENGKVLYINDEEVKLDESGEFSYVVELEEGDNSVVVTATSETDISTTKSMNIILKETGVVSKEGGSILPTVIIVIAVLVLIILSFMLIGKKASANAEGQKNLMSLTLGTVASGIFMVGSVILYIILYNYNRSAEYVALVGKDIAKAADYLFYEDVLFVVMIAMAVIFVVALIARILKGAARKSRVKKESKKAVQAAQPVQQMPVEQPVQQMQAAQPVQQMPVAQPVQQVSVEQPVQQAPVEQQAQQVQQTVWDNNNQQQ